MRVGPVVRRAILVLLLMAFSATSQVFTGKVVAVLDGDTIEVLFEERPVRIRLHGVDCPEQGRREAPQCLVPCVSCFVGGTACPKPRPPSADRAGDTFYITPTGTKYHRANCPYLSEKRRQISADEARASGYAPCSRCSAKPGSSGTSRRRPRKTRPRDGQRITDNG